MTLDMEVSIGSGVWKASSMQWKATRKLKQQSVSKFIGWNVINEHKSIIRNGVVMNLDFQRLGVFNTSPPQLVSITFETREA